MRVWVGKATLSVLAWVVSFAVAIGCTGKRPQQLLLTVALFLLVKGAAALSLGSFRELWRHTSLEDLVALVQSALVTTLVLTLLFALSGLPGLPPWTFALADGFGSLLLMASMRVAPRIYEELIRPRMQGPRRAVVLAGRPERVDLELRRMQRSGSGDRVIGLVLEGSPLEGARLRRLRVLSREQLRRLLERRRVHEVSLVPPASPGFTTRLTRLCSAYQVPCRAAASLLALTELTQAAEDLLGRPQAALDDAQVREVLSGRRVLVTGGGGSIGSELARQLARLPLAKLILVDRSENALFHAERSIASLGQLGFPVIGQVLDVRDQAAVERLFARHRPEVIFHAAAHKHVPLMERHPAEAVLNNVGGTRTLAEAADGFGARAFVFISTDKAVRPSSVMGVTKRIGELLVKAMSRRGRTRFVSVRFGNVLGSNGSVLPIFIEQIQRGGPVTVTHPEMTRFFMSIAEACQLVLRAAARGSGGELFVLDMGRPLRILELAGRVIERAGLRPGEDVPIVFSGPRPGEKLAEELILDGEAPTATAGADGVWSVSVDEPPLGELLRELDELCRLARAGDDHAVRGRLAELVPEYASRELIAAAPDEDEDEDVLEDDDEVVAGELTPLRAAE